MDTPAEILLTVLLGLALAVVGFFLVRLSARAHAALAVALLGPGPLTLPRLPGLPRRKRRVAVVAGSVVAAIAVAMLFFGGPLPMGWVVAVWREVSSPKRVRALFEGLGAWGPALLLGLQATQVVVALIPAAPLTLTGVTVFGPWWAVVAFFMGRRFGRPMVARLVGEKTLDECTPTRWGRTGGGCWRR